MKVANVFPKFSFIHSCESCIEDALKEFSFYCSIMRCFHQFDGAEKTGRLIYIHFSGGKLRAFYSMSGRLHGRTKVKRHGCKSRPVLVLPLVGISASFYTHGNKKPHDSSVIYMHSSDIIGNKCLNIGLRVPFFRLRALFL